MIKVNIMKNYLFKKPWPLACIVVIVLGACDPVDDGKGLDELVTGEKVMRHLQEFNRIAEENNGNRSSGTSGYEASIQYVKDLLDSKFKVQEQEFKYKHFKELENPQMSIVSPLSVIHI